MLCFPAVLRVNFTETTFTVAEADGFVTVCLQLLDVMEPTEAQVWVALEFANGFASFGK